jgi:probable rRNA maturation factor
MSVATIAAVDLAGRPEMTDPLSPTGVDLAGSVCVVASDEQTEVAIDADRWAELARKALVSQGQSGELTLTFVDVDDMASLNVEHLGGTGPTDVLSFPLDASDHDGPSVGPVLLGDVVVCPSIAAAQAADHAGTLDDELALLVVHGVLHVLGHDHVEPDETLLMRSLEIELLSQFHWAGPPPAGFTQEQN